MSCGLQDKVEGYKRQVDELTQQVQQLLAEKACPAPLAPAQQLVSMVSIENPGGHSAGAGGHSSCGTCAQEAFDLSDVSASPLLALSSRFLPCLKHADSALLSSLRLASL